MAHTQTKVVELISKDPSDRWEVSIQILLPWLRKKSLLLQDLDKGKISGVNIFADLVVNRYYRNR